jgi:hypothetical protein
VFQKRLFQGDLNFGVVTDSRWNQSNQYNRCPKIDRFLFCPKNFAESAVSKRRAFPANDVIFFHNMAANILELLDNMFVLDSTCIH